MQYFSSNRIYEVLTEEKNQIVNKNLKVIYSYVN